MYPLQFINRGPYEVGELVEKFKTIPTKLLARVWVGSLADSLYEYSTPPLGCYVRCLNVINKRLHGVVMDEIAIPPQHIKVQIMPTHVPTTPNTLLSKPKESNTPDHVVFNGDGIMVRNDEAPKRKPRSFSGEIRNQAKDLKPGEWIRVDPKKIKKNSFNTLFNQMKKGGEVPQLAEWYEAENGFFIINYPKI